jgi:RNA polymerase sigma factor (sigma-70 family)
MPSDTHIPQTIEHLFRHESGKMLAVLTRLFGFRQVEIAEDIVQETLVTAFETWKLSGMPEQPRAWLYRTAKNKAIDFLRRERNFKDNIAPAYIQKSLRDETPKNDWFDRFFLDQEIEDAQLRMMFACCHDALSIDNQLVLMLRTLCGLSVREIALALLLPEDTVGKRLLRTKEKLKELNTSLEVPAGAALLPRLDAVLQAIYLLFSEGYKSNTENTIIRRDLCDDALRLSSLLARHPATDLPKTHALLSLICFQTSRFDARLDADGHIILLEYQDRKRWNQALITLGYQHFKAAYSGKEISEYHLEAAIASYHASAPDFAQTNWKAIFFCYDLLYKINVTPFVAFNRAIALGYADGPKAGIAALLNISELQKNHLWHVALGDFYQKNKEKNAAIAAYRSALGLVQLPAEQQLIHQKMQNAILQTADEQA